mgnify:CR=1 FL=1
MNDAGFRAGPASRSGARFGPWLTALLLVAGLWAFGRPAFLISDDVGILRNLENGFEAPFISMLFGKILLALYRAAPAVPWYGLSLAAAHVVSLALFLGALFRLPIPRRGSWTAAALYLAVYAGFLVRVSFNSASMMPGISALLSWASFRAARTTPRPATAVGLGCALAGAYLVRVDGFYLVLLLGWPLLCASGAGRRLPLFAAPAVLVLLLNVLVAPRFAPEEYRRYADYNLARGRFMDFPIAQANTNNAALMAAVDWSPNDYRMLTHWFFLDEQVFSRARLKDVVRREDLARRAPPGYAGSCLDAFWSRYHRHLGLLGLALLWLGARAAPRDRVALGIYAGYALAIMLGLAVLYRFPLRVGAPSFLAATAILLFLAARNAGVRPAVRPRWLGVAGGAAAALFTVLWTAEAAAWSLENGSGRAVLDETCAALRDYPPATLFVGEPAIGLRMEFMHPLRARRAYPENILPAGWATFSPLFYTVLERHGLARGAEVLPAAVDNPGILFILYNENFGEVVATWLREHAGKEVRVEKVRSLPDDRGLYRLAGAKE